MPTPYRVRVTPRALEDLEEIFEYISHDSPEHARTMIRTRVDAIDSLDILSYRYPAQRFGRASGSNIRSMPVQRFLVRYEIDQRRKWVHVLHVRWQQTQCMSLAAARLVSIRYRNPTPLENEDTDRHFSANIALRRGILRSICILNFPRGSHISFVSS